MNAKRNESRQPGHGCREGFMSLHKYRGRYVHSNTVKNETETDSIARQEFGWVPMPRLRDCPVCPPSEQV